MEIKKVDYEDLQYILELQYLAYQSEAALLNNFDKVFPRKSEHP